jgi:hypothetical protein
MLAPNRDAGLLAAKCREFVKALLLPLLLLPLIAPAADTLERAYAPYGQLIITQFVSAPFPHPARAQGRRYKDKLYSAEEHYSDGTVAIFIPKGFTETGDIDFVVHFHGWNNTVAGTLNTFKLIEQFVESRKNAVLVVPEGPRNAPDSFGGRLEEPDGFKRFMDEVIETLRQKSAPKLKNPVLRNILLSGHSGGYQVMAAILDRGGLSARVKEVWLFDALYAEADKFLTWCDRRQGRLINIYTDNGGTKDDSEAMMELLRTRDTGFLAVEEAKVTEEKLKNARLVFLHTDVGHNDVLAKRETFCLFLRTSCLAEIATGGKEATQPR